MSARIFIVEDDRVLREELAQLLQLQGMEVCVYAPADAMFDKASKAALEAHPDCVIVDLQLPGASGHAICRDIRSESDVPIIILTSSESEFDEVMGMGLGADDYITKPYSPAILLAHMQSVLRRSANGAGQSVIAHNGVTLDLASAELEAAGGRTELTRNELRIMRLLMENAGTVITRQEMMRTLWESDEFIDDNTLTVNINRLRKKLSSIGLPDDFLSTRRGQGYII